MTKNRYLTKLNNKLLSIHNGVRSYEIDSVSYIFVNGKNTLEDMKLALEYSNIKNLSEITIKDGTGKKVISDNNLQGLINAMIVDGYELWKDKLSREDEINLLDETSETFDDDTIAIINRSW